MRRVAVFVGVLALGGCGGGDEEAAPADWCRETGTIMYLLDQHSTTHDQDRLGNWEESSPEDVRSEVTRMREVLRRYPVDPNAPDLVAARRPVEDFAESRCEGAWRHPAAVG